MIWLIAVLFVQLAETVFVMFAEYRNPAKTAAWLLIIFMFPLIGFVMYFFLGERYRHGSKAGGRYRHVSKTGKPLWLRQQTGKPGAVGADVEAAARAAGEAVIEAADEAMGEAAGKATGKAVVVTVRRPEAVIRYGQLFPESPITYGNRTKVLTNGEETFAAILAAIESACAYIFVEYYTLRDDEIGRVFQRALIKKARQGLDIRVIYDGVGSYKLPKRYVRELADAGIRCHPFLPLLSSLFTKRINYRNHRKIVVVDGAIGFLGGINVGDEYMGKNKQLGFWRDTHLQITGNAVRDLQRTFAADWRLACGEKLASGDEIAGGEEFAGGSEIAVEGKLTGGDEITGGVNLMATNAEFSQRIAEGGEYGEYIQIIASGPDQRGERMIKLFFAMITGANERLWLTTPYFIPDPSIVTALKLAAAKGVDIKVVIPGKPDTRLVHWASLSYVLELLAAGVEFYEYQKGFIHSKVLIADGTMATVGSANLDMRSFYCNFELNAVLFDRAVISRLERDFANDLQDSQAMCAENFAGRPKSQQLKEMAARMLSPLL
ncbi:MAG TPA: phospholipase D-like domain-containing protein [Bacilli bacterium]